MLFQNIYLLNYYLEKNEIYFKVKIIIPMLNIYSAEEYQWFPPEKRTTVYSWISYMEDKNKKGTYIWNTDKKKDDLIKNLIKNEIKKLNNDTERIIFVGFSMGGRYMLKILNELNIRILLQEIIKYLHFIPDMIKLLDGKE